jgi:hypothetical protein
MIRALPIFLGLLALLHMMGFKAMAADVPVRLPVVVELFTSQGCSSCPPAEAFLSELAERDNVVALEFHVDYWDYIGWKDSFAKPAFNERQKKYVGNLKARYAYTPQIVVDGKAHVVGSHRDEVESLMRQHQGVDPKAPAVALARKGDMLTVAIGPVATTATYDVVFVTFDKPHVTEVQRGENRGQKLKNSNVVRELTVLGAWTGKAASYDVPLAGKEGDGGCAILIQRRGRDQCWPRRSWLTPLT